MDMSAENKTPQPERAEKPSRSITLVPGWRVRILNTEKVETQGSAADPDNPILQVDIYGQHEYKKRNKQRAHYVRGTTQDGVSKEYHLTEEGKVVEKEITFDDQGNIVYVEPEKLKYRGRDLPDWLEIDEETLVAIKDAAVRKALTQIVFIPQGAESPDRLEKIYNDLVDKLAEDDVDDDQASIILSPLVERIEALAEQEAKPKVVDTPQDPSLGVPEAQFAQLVALMEQQVSVSAETRDLFAETGRKSPGISGLIATESAQGWMSEEYFNAHPEFWYTDLSPQGKDMIQQRIWLTQLAAIKRTYGMTKLENLVHAERVQIHADRIGMLWKEMPGFRQALTTIFDDLFTLADYHVPFAGHLPEKGKAKKTIRMVKLKASGVEKLNKGFSKYKRKTIVALETFLSSDSAPKPSKNVPFSGPRFDAEAAFAAAWNFIYISNVVESADTGKFNLTAVPGYDLPLVLDSREDDELEADTGDAVIRKERAVMESLAWAEQVRASFAIGEKARSKFDKREAGTDEGYLGVLGEYLAGEFRRESNEGKRIQQGKSELAPELLMASMLDMTRRKIGEDKEGNDIMESLGETLSGLRTSESFQAGQVKILNPGEGDFPIEDVRVTEMWGGDYVDKWDSQFLIFEAISGGFPLERGKEIEWCRKIGTALNKMRKSSLGAIYQTDAIVKTIIAGTFGLELGADAHILRIGEDAEYDKNVTNILSNPRILTGLRGGSSAARKRIMDYFSAHDQDSLSGILSFVPFPSLWSGKNRERALGRLQSRSGRKK